MALGKPAIPTPNQLELRAIQSAIGNIRQRIEAKKVWSRNDCRLLQLDTHSGRAALAVGPLIAALQGDADPRVQQAVSLLRGWNYRFGNWLWPRF